MMRNYRNVQSERFCFGIGFTKKRKVLRTSRCNESEKLDLLSEQQIEAGCKIKNQMEVLEDFFER